MKKIIALVLISSVAALYGCSKPENKAAETAPAAQAPAVQAQVAQAPADQAAAGAQADPHANMNMAGHPPMAGEAAGAAPAANAPQMKGKVVKVTHAAGYTYLQLDVDGKEMWVASSPANVKTGDTVAWAGGATMQNFTSKTLRRTFDQILFVDAVSVVNQ